MTDQNSQDKLTNQEIKKGDDVWVVIGISDWSYDCIPRPIICTVMSVQYGKVKLAPGGFCVPIERVCGTRSEALFRIRPKIKKKIEFYKSSITEMEEWLTGGAA